MPREWRSIEDTDVPALARGEMLIRPVEVVMRAGSSCKEDPDLESLLVPESPAAGEVRGIISNLIRGRAKQQDVAFLYEQGTGTLLALASVRMQGNLEVQARQLARWVRGEPRLERLLEISAQPYVGLLTRDARAPRVLNDGRTRLSAAAVRAVVEHAIDVRGEAPFMWAFCRHDNHPSLRAFARNAFHPDIALKNRTEQYVLVRSAGLKLAAAPPLSAYIPPRPAERLAA